MDSLRLSAATLILNDALSPDSDLEPCGPGVTQLVVAIARALGELPPSDTTTSTSTTDTTPIDAPTSLDATPALPTLASRADDLLTLSYQKLHTFPFSSVPLCWRALHVDASLLKAFWAHHLSSPTAAVVKTLDMTLILSGAPGRSRRATIEAFLAALATTAPPHAVLPAARDHYSPASDIDTVHLRFPVPTQFSPSVAAFQRHLNRANTPLLLRDAITAWPALQRWRRPSYLLSHTLGGARLVPIEVGRSYTDAGWGQRIVSVAEFLQTYMLANTAPADATGYLAQHNLFAQIPALRDDIAVPDYCYADPPVREGEGATKRLEAPLLNAWFGPRGTVSPLHTDPYANVLAQVVGSKYVRLYPPSETARVYPRGVEAGGVDMSNTAQVDVEAPGGGGEEGEFPEFEAARYVECVLSAGECLYIPAGWWHYVRSLEVSFSVSFWWN
ncbi:hypothetical protein EDC01DRAFT_650706 [Geopyxis carbonaria]|nr:hypothetical protein EDC01DRAFT_650706 [Geopyxis carbonaria]